jgi:hypothetical protein
MPLHDQFTFQGVDADSVRLADILFEGHCIMKIYGKSYIYCIFV